MLVLTFNAACGEKRKSNKTRLLEAYQVMEHHHCGNKAEWLKKAKSRVGKLQLQNMNQKISDKLETKCG